jgi:hypothetical protein
MCSGTCSTDTPAAPAAHHAQGEHVGPEHKTCLLIVRVPGVSDATGQLLQLCRQLQAHAAATQRFLNLCTQCCHCRAPAPQLHPPLQPSSAAPAMMQPACLHSCASNLAVTAVKMQCPAAEHSQACSSAAPHLPCGPNACWAQRPRPRKAGHGVAAALATLGAEQPRLAC